MPITIDGKKYMMSELNGTDIKAIHDFMLKSKSKAAIMIYVDEDGSIQSCGVWKTVKSKNILQRKVFIDIINKKH